MNDFMLKFNAYPLGQKILVLLLVIIGILAAFYGLHYVDYEEQMDRQRAEIKKLAARRDAVTVLERNREQILRRLEGLKIQLRAAKGKLPDSDNVPELLQRIYSQAKTAGLDIEVFQRLSNVEAEFYTEIPVDMELEGSFDELANFTFYVQENIPRIVNIKNLQIEHAKGQSGGSDVLPTGDLKIKAQATTYMYKPVVTPPPVKGGLRQ